MFPALKHTSHVLSQNPNGVRVTGPCTVWHGFRDVSSDSRGAGFRQSLVFLFGTGPIYFRRTDRTASFHPKAICNLLKSLVVRDRWSFGRDFVLAFCGR